MADPDTSGTTDDPGADARDDATVVVNRGAPNGGAAPSPKSGLRRSQHYFVVGLLAIVLLLAGLWFKAGPPAPVPPGDDSRPATGPGDATADRLAPFPIEPPIEPDTATDTAEVSPAPGPLAPQGVADIQRLLTALNFATGPADGTLHSRTVAAIRLYQRFAGLPVDGVPSAPLLDELRKVVQAMKDPAAADAR